MQSDKQPLVSILSLCYNQSAYCEETLDSIYQQTYENIEVILIDDCSKDDSVAVIEAWIEKHPDLTIQFIAHQQNQGICKSLNEGLSLAKGKYIQMIACDDLMMADKTSIHLAAIEQSSYDVAFIYSDAYLIDQNGKRIDGLFLEKHRGSMKPFEGDIYKNLLRRNFIPAMTAMVRKEVLISIGRYDENLTYEDYDMWLRLAKKYKVIFSPYVSAQYRLHAQNTHLTHHRLSSDFLRNQILIFRKHSNTDIGMKKLNNTYSKAYKIDPEMAYQILSISEDKNAINKSLYYSIMYKLPYKLYKLFLKGKQILRSSLTTILHL